jgi:L-threonylcarbamoyladenylate synthase
MVVPDAVVALVAVSETAVAVVFSSVVPVLPVSADVLGESVPALVTVSASGHRAVSAGYGTGADPPRDGTMHEDGAVESTLVSTDPEFAAGLLAAGGLVGMPTETVYGLGANAADPVAVARIYTVKQRPTDHPLIVHLGGAEELDDWATSVPEYARRLAERFWPGPMTLILPRTMLAGDHVTGGQDTVGLRVPSHPMARRLLAAFGGAVAAPSANRFGRVSPTLAEHVLAELRDVLSPGRDVILDGGDATVGLESTIVDCTRDAPSVLRPGAVTDDEISAVGGVPVTVRAMSVRAPGTLAQHYAPRAEVVPVEPDGVPEIDDPVTGRVPGTGVGFLALASYPTPPGLLRLAAPDTVEDYAHVLYLSLRQADTLGLRRVLAVLPVPVGIGVAIRDRLERAAAPSSAST